MGVETLEKRGLGVEYGSRKWYGTHLPKISKEAEVRRPAVRG